jgi:hypothetical protein
LLPLVAWVDNTYLYGNMSSTIFRLAALSFVFLWNDPLNWHTHDGHTLRERKREWREESDIPGSFSEWQ